MRGGQNDGANERYGGGAKRERRGEERRREEKRADEKRRWARRGEERAEVIAERDGGDCRVVQG
jgi:hypothetical protein